MNRNPNNFFNNSISSENNLLGNSQDYMDPPGLKYNNYDYNYDNEYNNTYAPTYNRTSSPRRQASRVSLVPSQRMNSPIKNLQNSNYNSQKNRSSSPPIRGVSRPGNFINRPVLSNSNEPNPPSFIPRNRDLTNFRNQAVSPSKIALPSAIDIESINFNILSNRVTDVQIFNLNVFSYGQKKFELNFNFYKEDDSIYILENVNGENTQNFINISNFNELERKVGLDQTFRIILESEKLSVIFYYMKKKFSIELKYGNFTTSTYNINVNSEEQKIQLQADLLKIYDGLKKL